MRIMRLGPLFAVSLRGLTRKHRANDRRHSRSAICSIGVVFWFLVPVSTAAQAHPPIGKDPQAVVVLQQAMSAFGGQALAGIRDVTATGTITYSWAGEQVPGSVEIKVRNGTEFRMDSTTSYGSRTLSIIGDRGKANSEDGKISALRYSEATNGGVLAFPNWLASEALTDPLVNVSYGGTTSVNGVVAVVVQLTRYLPFRIDPNGKLGQLRALTLFIDPKTGLVVKAQHLSSLGKRGGVQPFKVETYFSDYRVTSGVALPFSIAFSVDGQQMWSIRLDKVEFNSGLTDADFNF